MFLKYKLKHIYNCLAGGRQQYSAKTPQFEKDFVSLYAVFRSLNIHETLCPRTAEASFGMATFMQSVVVEENYSNYYTQNTTFDKFSEKYRLQFEGVGNLETGPRTQFTCKDIRIMFSKFIIKPKFIKQRLLFSVDNFVDSVLVSFVRFLTGRYYMESPFKVRMEPLRIFIREHSRTFEICDLNKGALKPPSNTIRLANRRRKVLIHRLKKSLMLHESIPATVRIEPVEKVVLKVSSFRHLFDLASCRRSE